MGQLPSRALVLGAVCFLGGWALVLISGHGGNSTGGFEIVWRIGGIMVYASALILPLAAFGATLSRRL